MNLHHRKSLKKIIEKILIAENMFVKQKFSKNFIKKLHKKKFQQKKIVTRQSLFFRLPHPKHPNNNSVTKSNFPTQIINIDVIPTKFNRKMWFLSRFDIISHLSWCASHIDCYENFYVANIMSSSHKKICKKNLHHVFQLQYIDYQSKNLCLKNYKLCNTKDAILIVIFNHVNLHI